MRTFLTVLICFTFTIQSIQVCYGNLDVSLLTKSRKEIESGSSSNVLVMFSNNYDTAREFEIMLKSSGFEWKQIINNSTVLIEGKSSLNKVITIRIPENVPAGDIDIELEAYEKPGNVMFGRISIPVKVKPKYALNIEKIKFPDFLLSSESSQAGYKLFNLSNTDIELTAYILNGSKREEYFLKIPKDSSFVFNVNLVSPANLLTQIQHVVSLTAYISGMPETSVYSSHITNFIPSNIASFDGYHRFPISFSTILAMTNRHGPMYYAFMYDIKGSGFLDEKGKHLLDFQFRGPDRRGDPILGLNDVYKLSYRSQKTEFVLGDFNYGLSALTDQSRLGRGVRFQQKFSKFTLGGFYHIPRYFPLIKSTYSVYTSLNLKPELHFSTGILLKTDTANHTVQLLTFSGNMKLRSWLRTDFEIAAGNFKDQIKKAFKGTAYVNTSLFNSYFNILYADPDFTGYLSNSLIISTGTTTFLGNKLSLSANYNVNASNIALDTLYANAPYSKNTIINTTYRLSPTKSLGLSYNSIGLEDRAAIKMFHYERNFIRINYQSNFKRFDLSLNGEAGKLVNLLEAENNSSNFLSSNLILRFELNNVFSARGFVNYQGGKQQLVTGAARFNAGGSLLMNYKKTIASVDFQTDYELKDYYFDRNLLSAQIRREWNTKHEIDFSTNYHLSKNSLSRREFSIQIRYTYKLNLAVSKKRDIGSLTGKLTGKGVEKVNGIIFRINGNMTLTDKTGNFRFPMLPVGKYEMYMDESNFDLHTLAGKPGPYPIEINQGVETKFETFLTKAASINGQLVIKEDEKSGQKGYFAYQEEIDRLIVEVSGGTEVFRLYTSSNGSFHFSDLRPGEWKLKIYKNGLPSGYSIEKEEFTFQLNSGDAISQEIIIHKKTRVIKIQKGF